MNSKKWILIYCSMVMLLTGCWDNVPIEERGFVVGVALDLADEQEFDNDIVTMTSQFVIPGGLGNTGQGGGKINPFTNISVSKESLFEISREMATQMGRIPYYEHLMVIIVSSEILDKPDLFAGLMDSFLRDHEMRREIRIMVSEGEAKAILDLEPESEEIPAMYINDTMENRNKSIEKLEPVRIGDMHEFLLDHSSYTLPNILLEENKINSEGAIVFHGESNRMVGKLNGDETKGLNLIRENIQGGFIKFEIDDKLMIYEIENTKSKIKVNVKDQNTIDIAVTIDAEGIIAEMAGSKSLVNPDYLSEIEDNISKKIEQIVNQVLEKGQKELEVDIFGFGKKIRQKHYQTWQEIKKDWDSGEKKFTNSSVSVSANATVRTIGATDKAKDFRNE